MTGDGEEESAPPANQPTIATLIGRRLSRRALLAGAAAVVGAAAIGCPAEAADFVELPHRLDDRDHLVAGYRRRVLLRWGDPVLAEAPAFDVGRQSAAAQAAQAGYNCDYTAFMPLPAGGSGSDHGLLFVNHEYTIAALMFDDVGGGRAASHNVSAAQADVEMAAHGASVVEVRREGGGWRTVAGPLNRRITMTTPMRVAGPAAGHALLRTEADPTGRHVLGMLANCAGGVTPWGTVLSCEENFHGAFVAPGALAADPMRRRYTVGERSWYGWWRYHPRFDVSREPNECHRFGWVVEIDPYDPASVPVKRTALGRFRHECASCVVNGDGRVVAYQGDDQRFEYIYKFVSRDAWDPGDRARNRDLLDHGTLHAARFHDDGRLEWLPLVHGVGPLTAANGLPDQAAVVTFARRAAELMGATPMDRPEDVEVDPVSGRVYVALTGNDERAAAGIDAANPRAANRHGHVLELSPPLVDGRPDHAATQARWDIFLLAGRPGVDAGASYHPGISDAGWLSCPDNLAFDPAGRIWIATDGAAAASGVADALYVARTAGPARALTRLFHQAPVGAEITGPCFTPDGRTLFLSVQHPGQSPTAGFADPPTRWPDFDPAMPPRPSVIAITRDDGGPVGG
ncbi:MAG: PhoX family phosphatase [Alphaproteobacteria bacterium]